MSDVPTMHIDGAARGNPGPAAYAVVITRPGLPPVEDAQTMGTATNNVAEYTALVRGLEKATELGLKRLAVFSDSELLVKQMAGEYRVKNADLQPLYEEASRLRRGFDAVTITHVRRGNNARADELCNIALDGQKKKASGTATTAGPKPPKVAVTDAAVRDEALTVLTSAANAWAANGVAKLPVAAVWEQLWSVLEDGGVLKKK
jgi:ribonuclease HI